MGWAIDRLNRLKSKEAPLVAVAETLRLGGLDDWSEGRASKRWVPCEAVLNVDGSMFGGHIAALADQMMAFAAMSVVPDGSAFRTINLNLQFFKVGRAHPLQIESRVTAQTKSLISVEVDFLREGDGMLIARGAAQQMVLPIAAV